MNPNNFKNRMFYVNKGNTYECIFSNDDFAMISISEYAPYVWYGEEAKNMWEKSREATPEEIRAYKIASPRYPDYEPEPEKPCRKVVQFYPGIPCAALCDDGTMWELPHNATEWTRLPDIPQDEQKGLSC